MSTLLWSEEEQRFIFGLLREGKLERCLGLFFDYGILVRLRYGKVFDHIFNDVIVCAFFGCRLFVYYGVGRGLLNGGGRCRSGGRLVVKRVYLRSLDVGAHEGVGAFVIYFNVLKQRTAEFAVFAAFKNFVTPWAFHRYHLFCSDDSELFTGGE